jgi:hypothetical protein
MTMVRTFRRWVLQVPLFFVLGCLVLQASCAGESEEAGSCSKLCEKGQDECPALPRVECEDQCLYEDARAQETGCDGEADAVAGCSAALDDICSTPTACDSELRAFWACVGAYCMNHPSSRYCNDKPR